jgi:hypothetical protein
MPFEMNLLRSINQTYVCGYISSPVTGENSPDANKQAPSVQSVAKLKMNQSNRGSFRLQRKELHRRKGKETKTEEQHIICFFVLLRVCIENAWSTAIVLLVASQKVSDRYCNGVASKTSPGPPSHHLACCFGTNNYHLAVVMTAP